MSGASHVTVAIEGDLDEYVATRLVAEAGGLVARVHGRRGKSWLRQQIGGYKNAARHARWFVLVDLDRDHCPPALRRDWVVEEQLDGLCFRVAVPSAESWLLADLERLATFLRVSRSRVPTDPDFLPDAKQALIDAARHSNIRSIRDAIVPRGSARTGPLYNPMLGRFVEEQWDPVAAATRSPSLATCRIRLAELVQRQLPDTPP